LLPAGTTVAGWDSHPLKIAAFARHTSKVGSNLSAPVVAGGKLFAADKDAHAVFALDAGTGERLWDFTAGGRVDSPPACAFGQVVFGCRDGYVYCLNAADGALRWRFLAAERDERLFDFEQLESVWPVSGSVLIVGKTVCFTAGRSVFLDGGILFWKLALTTGKVLAQKRWTRKAPSGKDYHHLVSTMAAGKRQSLSTPYGLAMPPANNDLLSANEKHLFMSSQVLTLDGERIMTPPVARNSNDEQSHIFSPTGLLDGSWWHRGYFAFGNGVEGGCQWANSLKRVLPGKLICADAENVYGFGRKPQYNRWTLPLEFRLYSAPKGKVIVPKEGRKGKKVSSLQVTNWETQIPIWVQAMFVTDDALFVAGNRDLYDEEGASGGKKPFSADDERFALQQEHLEGKYGSLLEVVDKRTGRKLHSLELPEMPVWDGMIAADGKIFMTTTGGSVLCLDMKGK